MLVMRTVSSHPFICDHRILNTTVHITAVTLTGVWEILGRERTHKLPRGLSWTGPKLVRDFSTYRPSFFLTVMHLPQKKSKVNE